MAAACSHSRLDLQLEGPGPGHVAFCEVEAFSLLSGKDQGVQGPVHSGRASSDVRGL